MTTLKQTREYIQKLRDINALLLADNQKWLKRHMLDDFSTGYAQKCVQYSKIVTTLDDVLHFIDTGEDRNGISDGRKDGGADSGAHSDAHSNTDPAGSPEPVV